jgi:hypothetical protein
MAKVESGKGNPENGTVDAERERLEQEKLKLEIADLRRSPRRTYLSTAASLVLTAAAVAVALAGFFLNATISKSSDQQRAFERYNKLITDFGKNGPQKVAAIVGLSDYLVDPQRGPQTEALLLNDLSADRDPLAIQAIAQALSRGGGLSLGSVRLTNVEARDRLDSALSDYVLSKLAAVYRSQQKYSNWRTFAISAQGNHVQSSIADDIFFGLDSHSFDNIASHYQLLAFQFALRRDLIDEEYPTILYELPPSIPKPEIALSKIAQAFMTVLVTGRLLNDLVAKRDHVNRC